MEEAIEAVEEALLEIGEDTAIQPSRPYLEVTGMGGFLLNMGYLKRLGGVGVKIASSYPVNVEKNLPTVASLIILLDPYTGLPLSVMEGGYLTALKTGAVGGVAVKLLSRLDSENVALIGSGVQARTQLIAISKVRSIKRVKVFSRQKEKTLMFAQQMGRLLELDIEAADNSISAVKNADIIVTATTSSVPVIDGLHVPDGAHINGIGSFTSDAAEIDLHSINRSRRVYVDNYEAINVGDVKFAMREGLIQPSDVIHIADVLIKRAKGRKNNNELTIFKSVGGSAYDVAVAWHTYKRAIEKNVGVELDLR